MDDNTNYSSKKLAFGYGIIIFLIGFIIYFYTNEWRQLEILQQESREINNLRQNVHNAYAQMLDLTLYGETILEWQEEDTVIYHAKRMVMDSLLCDFKAYYPPARIDTLCNMLADKEQQLFHIWKLYGKQEKLNERIAKQVPIIAYKSTQEPAKKKGGLFGIFKKKQQATTSSMLYTLNKDVVERRQSLSINLLVCRSIPMVVSVGILLVLSMIITFSCKVFLRLVNR